MFRSRRIAAFLLSPLLALQSPWLLASVEDEIRSRLQQQLQPGSRWPQMGELAAPLEQVYGKRDYQPIWLEQGQPSARALAAIDALKDAPADALRPEDYEIKALEQRAANLAQQTGNDRLQADFEMGLSLSLARFTRDLNMGRIDPRKLGLQMDVTPKRNALPGHIARVLAADDVPSALKEARPVFGLYARLRSTLLEYRLMAQLHPKRPDIPPLPSKKLEPGQPWVGTEAMAKWLVVLGDMKVSELVAGQQIYQGAVADAVRRFQTRHGLSSDGVIGAQTYNALTTPLPKRVRQLELALERMRWVDEAIHTQRFVVVNIPQYTLWAYEPNHSAPVLALRMPVVVGKALKHETPVLVKEMSTLVFSPYWNVPRSIAVKEIMPKLRQDPMYLVSQDMELVGPGYRQAGLVGKEDMSQLALGNVRIRQRPGDKNALGGVKFVFPNDDAIYLHSTSQQSLFSRGRRDFSHGCIRVAEPVALAQYALRLNNGSWDEKRIRDSMQAGKERHIPLKQRIPVLILYSTANVEPDGQAVFVNDIYDHDKKLEAALSLQAH